MKQKHSFDHTQFLVPAGQSVKLTDYQTEPNKEFKGKSQAKKAILEDVSALADAQELLWANARRSVLIIFQALDAAGKDSTIKHVMSGINPQGCDVHSFKAPSTEELSHHFLWRPTRFLPARGRIGIFNRSYYEEVLVVRVHPEFLEKQKLPPRHEEDVWETRFEDINNFEHTLDRNGMLVLKFFLHVSKHEQKNRFIERLENPEKHWKFSEADLKERGFWDDYMHAYENMLGSTSTRHAPWYVIPADDKWYMRACVADIITARIEELDLEYPQVTDEEHDNLKKALEILKSEKE